MVYLYILFVVEYVYGQIMISCPAAVYAFDGICCNARIILFSFVSEGRQTGIWSTEEEQPIPESQPISLVQ